jgi:hypothetical protein
MRSIIKTVSFDAADALALARFWAAVLGTDVDEDATTARAYVEAPGWGGPSMWFVRVPEPAGAAKNRMLFDLRSPTTMRAEVVRLVALGATVLEHFDSHTTLADPEGNVFCVELGPHDGAAG